MNGPVAPRMRDRFAIMLSVSLWFTAYTRNRGLAAKGGVGMTLIETDVSPGRKWMIRLYGAVVVTTAALITANQLGHIAAVASGSLTFWLITGLALLAGAQTFITSYSGGSAVV